MENELSKKEFLSNLYALRAGLSVISQGADELTRTLNASSDTKSRAIRSCNWQLSDSFEYNDDIGEWAYSNSRKNEYFESEFKKLEAIGKPYDCKDNDFGYGASEEQKKIGEEVFCEWLKTSEPREHFIKQGQAKLKDVNYYKREVNKTKKSIKGMIALIACIILGVIVGIVLIPSRYRLPVLISFGIFVLIGLGMIIGGIDTKRGNLKENNRKLKEVVKIYDSYNESIENIDKCLAVINQCDHTYLPIANGIKQNYSLMYMELQKTFNRVLDERDWKYLDMIIYYFETGRADDKKEALQLLEREIQTQRIVESVEAAKQCICSTIRMAASQISSQLRTISSKLSQIASYQQTQIAQNAELISQTRLQNALIEKSNVTSEQLMKNVKYIKEYGVRIKK